MFQVPTALLVAGLLLTGLEQISAQQTSSVGAQQITIPPEQFVPGVELGTYTLIASDSEAARQRADAVMAIKLSWPLAMRTKDPALFDRILARDFTLREPDGRLYQRAAYIRARVESRDRVVAVRYENVVLQFFGQLAIMTYRNVLDHVDATGRPDTLSLTWADIFIQEHDEWKIAASHLIDERVLQRSAQ
jgi:ketosteroid isomerase-like protein